MAPLSIVHGPTLDYEQAPDLAQALLRSVRNRPEGRFVFIDASGTASSATYRQIWERALRISGGLQRQGARPGDKLVLYFRNCADFVPALWASILSGAIPIPLARLTTSRHARTAPELLDYLMAFVNEPLIVTEMSVDEVRLSSRRPRIASVFELETAQPADTFPISAPADPAVAIVSSGTTSRPNLVVLSHRAMLHRWWAKIPAEQHHSRFLYWSPFDHVLGLGVANPSLHTKIHMSPELFVKCPGAWLDAIARYQITHAMMTNFGMSLIERHLKSAPASNWDLRSIEKIGVGAETISPQQCRRFIECLRPFGLRSDAIILGYGLTECGPVVGGGHPLSLERLDETDPFVLLDSPTTAHSVRIVDATGRIVPEGQVGSVQVKGPTMASGYLGDQRAFAELTTADGWLRTGDLGSLHGGMLKITGREKEVIVINAKKYACAEIEAIALSVPGVEEAYAVPFRDDRGMSNDTHFALFFVAPTIESCGGAARRLRSAIASRFGIAPAHLVPIKAGAVPRTRSGKVRRLSLSEQLENGAFDHDIQDMAAKMRADAGGTAAASLSETEQIIAAIWTDILGFAGFRTDADFFELGADSLAAVRLIVALEATFDRRLPVDVFQEAATIVRLAEFFDRPGTARPESPRALPRPSAGQTPASPLEPRARADELLRRRVGESSFGHEGDAAPRAAAGQRGQLVEYRDRFLKRAVRYLRATHPHRKLTAALAAQFDATMTPSLTLHELVEELGWAYAWRRIPRYQEVSPFQWANACHELLVAGRIKVLEYAARNLRESHPDVKYIATLVAWFDAIPRQLPSPLRFFENADADVQIVRRADCDTVLFCFCAADGTLGVPLNLAHEWLGRLPVSLVYLKDFRNIYGASGYPTLGPDREAAVTALQQLAQNLGATRLFTFGVSLGGYAALYYGQRLGAQGVLSLGSSTDLTPEFIGQSPPLTRTYLDVIQQAADYAVNLRTIYQAAERRPSVLLAYSQQVEHDWLQAEQMAGLPGVHLIAVRNYIHHNVIDPLIQRQELLDLLMRLLSLEKIQRDTARSDNLDQMAAATAAF
jgi:acyl-CoA synthetase (AMP-forming)/AMP-acid ligase II/acyl carrier protein